MRYCSQCGAQIPDEARFCPKCGASLPPMTNTGNSNAAQQQNAYQQNTYQQNTYQQSTYNSYQNGQTNPYKAPSQGPDMKWYHYLIYGELFISAAWFFINGIVFCFNLPYRSQLQFMTTSEKTMNIIYGLGFFVLCFLALFARHQLAHYRKNAYSIFFVYNVIAMLWSVIYIMILSLIEHGPIFFGILYSASYVTGLLYTLGASVYGGGFIFGVGIYTTEGFFSLCLLIEIAIAAGYLGLNNIYFSKRKDLFQN